MLWRTNFFFFFIPTCALESQMRCEIFTPGSPNKKLFGIVNKSCWHRGKKKKFPKYNTSKKNNENSKLSFEKFFTVHEFSLNFETKFQHSKSFSQLHAWQTFFLPRSHIKKIDKLFHGEVLKKCRLFPFYTAKKKEPT